MVMIQWWGIRRTLALSDAIIYQNSMWQNHGDQVPPVGRYTAVEGFTPSGRTGSRGERAGFEFLHDCLIAMLIYYP